MPFDTATVQLSRQKLRLVDLGTGPVVVVLHGWGGRIESVAPVIDCLAADHRVLAIDLPGFGDSPPPSEAWGTPDYAACLVELLTSLEIDSADFVGHSYGAKTSLYLAATRPAIVRRLVLVGSSGLRRAPSVAARAKRIASKSARAAGRLGPLGRSLQEALYRRIASQDYRDAGPMRPTLVRVVNEDLRPLLGQIEAPTLLVWGVNDEAVPVSHARIMEREIPDAGLVVFEEAGHFAYLDQPRRFCTILRHFLSPEH